MKKEERDRIEFARDQRRRSNSFEVAMWAILRNRSIQGMKFRRQHPLGPYTADFYCAEAKLVIEIDGEPHFTPQGRARDRRRDQWMQEQGIRVLRFTGNQIECEMHLIRMEIERTLQNPSPPAPLPASGARGAQSLTVNGTPEANS